MSSNNVRGDISRAGIIFLQGLQLRALLECGFYSREGLIWGNTVIKGVVWRAGKWDQKTLKIEHANQSFIHWSSDQT